MEENWEDLAKQLWWEMTPQTNYHGSPYTFNKFDDSKFLTGEGFMAHGPGHYSADYITTAKQYKPTGEYFTYNIINKTNNKPLTLNDTYSIPFGTSAKFNMHKDDIMHYLTEALRKNKKNVDAYYTYSMVDRVPEASHVLNNLQDYELVKERHTGNLYKVNVPNENFMWKEGLPIEQQNNYIRNIAKNNNTFIDYSKYIPEDAMNYRRILHKLDFNKYPYIKRIYDLIGKPKFTWEYPSAFNDKHKDLIVRMLNKIDLDDQRDLLNYFRGNDPKILPNNTIGDMQKLYGSNSGVKGIRAKGSIDGPINVTFSGKDIRMANTITQQIRNRIPVQTLGKIARKLYNYPVVKGGVKFLDMFGPSLMIPDIIKQQGLYPYTNKEKQRMKNILEKKYGIKINGNRITI